MKEDSFDVFVEECHYWQRKLNLLDWRLEIRCNANYEVWDTDSLGMCAYNLVGRTATIWLNPNAPDQYYEDEHLRKIAFHEVAELFLGEIRTIGEARFDYGQEDMDAAAHRVIRTMENQVFEEDYGKRRDSIPEGISGKYGLAKENPPTLRQRPRVSGEGTSAIF